MAAVFERAAAELKAAIVAVSDTHKLQLYGLFKQATVGDCSVAAPSAFRPVERAKWNEAPSLIKRFASSDFVEYFEDSLLDKQNRIESFISNFYCKNAPDARSYHLQRITEEFGPPTE
ncbi:hypothetical protein AM588_10011633 [Phytophthora nicotianae]|uniref:ACB domain-containing protein n=1 Tax=Phytophthora nicotianae TaxID=4792 RepID=A0A0W8DPW5_PHYNI|nr:hypothetical protein AM588_10011633 [Phytophthora nicotianae]